MLYIAHALADGRLEVVRLTKENQQLREKCHPVGARVALSRLVADRRKRWAHLGSAEWYAKMLHFIQFLSLNHLEMDPVCKTVKAGFDPQQTLSALVV